LKGEGVFTKEQIIKKMKEDIIKKEKKNELSNM
jgi:hypothetical protein